MPRNYRKRTGRKIKQFGLGSAVRAAGRLVGGAVRRNFGPVTARRFRRNVGKVGATATLAGAYGLYAKKAARAKRVVDLGGINQFTTENKTTGRLLNENRVNRMVLRAAREASIFNWKAHKSFDDNGYLWAAQSIDNTQRLFPIYALLLNGRDTGVAPSVAPMRRLAAFRTAGADDGRLLWNDVVGIDPSTGAAGTQYLNTEYRSTTTHPGQSMFWNWAELKLNLYGAKSKAVKWSIMICRVTEEDVSPWHTTSGSLVALEAQQTFEELIRQYTYNPIMKLNYHKRTNRVKVIHTWEKVIQPNTSIDGDQDPHTHVFKWFQRWNRNVGFDRITATQTTGERTTDDVDYAGAREQTQYLQEPYSNYPNPNEQVFALIRATAFSTAPDSGASVTNDLYGSFDVSMRSKFTRLD